MKLRHEFISYWEDMDFDGHNESGPSDDDDQSIVWSLGGVVILEVMK